MGGRWEEKEGVQGRRDPNCIYLDPLPVIGHRGTGATWKQDFAKPGSEAKNLCWQGQRMLTCMAYQVLGIWSPLVQAPRLKGVTACRRSEGAFQLGCLRSRAPGQEGQATPAGAGGYQRDQMTASSRQRVPASENIRVWSKNPHNENCPRCVLEMQFLCPNLDLRAQSLEVSLI